MRLLADVRARAASSARSSSRPPAGSGRTGTSPTRRCSRSTATGDAARARVGLALVVADHQRRAPRDARARRRSFDLTAFCDLRHRRARARSSRVQQVVDARSGRRRSARSSTRRCSTPRGGFRSDLTVMRLGDDHFRVVTGGAHGMADLQVVRRPPAGDGTAQIVDLTSSVHARSASGARGRATSSARSPSDDVSHEGFPFVTCRTIEMGSLRVLASRISYVGELGWELYVPIEQGARLWDMVCRGGRAARRRAGRHRRLRHHRPAREGLPRLRLRARRRVRRRRGRHGAAQGQGRRTSSARRRTSRQREEDPATVHVHADRRRPHLGVRREALHARRRADPDARRRHADRRARPPLVRHERGRRRRRSASTS